MSKKKTTIGITKEQWKAVFEEALELKKSKLWQVIPDGNLVAIQLQHQEEPVFIRPILDDKKGIQEIMIYPNRADFHTYERFLEFGKQKWFNKDAEEACIRVLYTSKEQLTADEYQLTRDLEYRFRGSNGWIAFRKEEIGYAGSMPFSSEEITLLKEILNQLLALVKDYSSKTVAPDFAAGEAIYRYYDQGQKKWTQVNRYLGQIVTPLHLISISLQDQNFLADLMKLSKTKFAIEVDCNYAPNPVEDEEGDMRYPQVLAIINNLTGEVLMECLIDYETEYSLEEQVMSCLIDFIVNNGRPRRVYVRSANLNIGFRDALKQLNIPLRQRNELEKTDKQWAKILKKVK